MPSILVFLVAYAGIGGKNASAIDKQVYAALDDQAEVEKVKVTRAQRKKLVTRSEDAPDLVRDLDADVVIAGEVERTRRGATLRIVVYSGDGTLADFVELPVGKKHRKKLGRADLESLVETLQGDIDRLTAPPPPKPKAAPVVAASEEVADDAEVPALEAAATAAPTRAGRRDAWLRISAGVGMRQRAFSPGPAMVYAYQSSPVPAAQVAVEARPLRFASVGAELERTLTMSSDVDGEAVPSSITGWQAVAALRVPIGAIELAAIGGVGARDFVIDRAEPAPTPDGHYVYGLVGGRLTARLGSRVELRGFAAWQPVVAGDVPMATAPEARAGIEVGGALEIGASDHVFVVAEGGYQRFTWSWTDGTSVDEYPSGTLSIGARY